MPSLEVEQFQYKDDGLVLNGDPPVPFFDIMSVQGIDSAPVRLQTTEREGIDGGYVDSEFETIRTVVIEGNIYADVFAMETYLDSLKANFAVTNTNYPLYFQTDAGQRMILAKAQGIRYNKDQLRRIGSANAQIQFIAEDPRIYSPTPLSGSVQLAAEVTTGRGYDKEYEFGYGGIASVSTVWLTMDGNRPTPAVVRIDGPVQNPSVIFDNTGAIITVQTTLNEGDYIEIDLGNKSVLRNGQASLRSVTTITGGWPMLVPGLNTFRFSGIQTPPTPVAELTVTAYSAWR